MKTLAIALTLALVSGSALAQGRPSTTTMSCRSASGIVQSSGAVVLSTGGDTFDRFVRDASFCAVGQRLRPGFAPSTDNPACLIGYRCFDESLDPR